MPLYSPEMIADLWKATGGTNCAIAVAVALAESAGNSTAININQDPWHSIDRGLWQINNYWHSEFTDACCFDATCNANAASFISLSGKVWDEWVTYEKEMYKPFL